MIFPCPELPQSWVRSPMTVALVMANVVIYLLFFAGPELASPSERLSDRDLRTAGRIYLMEQNAGLRPAWATMASVRTPERLETYGQLAIRDRRFLKILEQPMTAPGDQIAFQTLSANAKKFDADLKERPLYQFGLSSDRKAPISWITYQFAHAGALHLLSNIFFLILLGMALERRIGSAPLLGLYLIGGIAGGWLFLKTDPNGIIPMVGASGSVSALIAAYPVLEMRRRIRYFFFLLPMPGLYGFIYLPTLLMIPLYLATDFASLWSNPEGLSTGVAYAAHVGGALFGVTAGLILRRIPQPEQSPDASYSP